MTAKTICPGDKYFMPSCWLSSLQLGGKIDLTRTRLNSAMPAERSANSNEVSFPRSLPTPLVKKAPFGTGPIYLFLQHRAIDLLFVSFKLADQTLHGIHLFVFAKDRAHRVRVLAECAPIADRVDYGRHQILSVF